MHSLEEKLKIFLEGPYRGNGIRLQFKPPKRRPALAVQVKK